MATINTILKAIMICVICAATLMSGCIEDDNLGVITTPTITPIITSTSTPIITPTTPVYAIVIEYMDDVRTKYDKAKFDDSYMRESDNFELYYSVHTSESYHSYFYMGDDRWSVNTWSRYPPYDNMEDDENHGFSIYIDHYDTIRDAYEKMVKGSETTFSCPGDHFIILETSDYGDQSYRYISPEHADSNDVVSGYSGNIFILKDKTIGRLHIGRYTDMDECDEVLDYYAPFLNEVLDNIN